MNFTLISLSIDSKVKLFNQLLVIVDLRYGFILFIVEKLLSAEVLGTETIKTFSMIFVNSLKPTLYFFTFWYNLKRSDTDKNKGFSS